MATVHATNLKWPDAKILMLATSMRMQQKVTKALATSAATAAWPPTPVTMIQQLPFNRMMLATMSRALDA